MENTSPKSAAVPDNKTSPDVFAENRTQTDSMDTGNQEEQVIPEHVNSFEKFFAVLLRSSVNDYMEATKSEKHSEELWRRLCRRASLLVPTERIHPKCESVKTHFYVRAALVLEEAREAMSRGVSRNWRQRETAALQLALRDTQQPSVLVTLNVKVQESLRRDHGITFLKLKNEPHDNGQPRYFTDEEKQHLMPGQVMECSLVGGQNVLGCVLPCQKERIHKLAEFDLLIFQPLSAMSESWTLTPVDAFIGPCRQFAAVTDDPGKIPFLQALLGNQQCPPVTSHNVNNVTSQESSKEQDVISASHPTVDNTEKTVPTSEPSFTVPKLNENQEKAVSSFLESPPKSITIVQG
jgi:hypothetical protein